MKYKTTAGRYARNKGRRAEIKWRDELRRIYTTQQEREKIKRVPMSGASWMKGDVVDLNDYDSLYEIKNQETLSIPSWWRQAVREASSRTPILVITQNNRPFYVFMEPSALMSLVDNSIYKDIPKVVDYSGQAYVLEHIDEIGDMDILSFTMPRSKDDIYLYAIKGEFYIKLKKDLTTATA